MPYSGAREGKERAGRQLRNADRRTLQDAGKKTGEGLKKTVRQGVKLEGRLSLVGERAYIEPDSVYPSIERLRRLTTRRRLSLVGIASAGTGPPWAWFEAGVGDINGMICEMGTGFAFVTMVWPESSCSVRRRLLCERCRNLI